MKLTDFTITVDEETNKASTKISWDLAFVICVLIILSSCFIYDAHKEQNLHTSTVILKHQ